MASVVTLSPQHDPIHISGAMDLSVAAQAPSPIAVRICADLHRLSPPEPIVLVTRGSLAELLPNIALAQRTAHRRVAGYVLIDPVFPRPAADWPDAPVLVLGASSVVERDTRLRGWTYRNVTSAREVEQFVRAFVEDVTLT